MRRTLLIALLLGLFVASSAAAKIVHLTVMHTNDIHGGISPSDATYMNREFPPKLGGAASMITLLLQTREKAEARGDDFLLLDSGDIFQGTPIGTLTKGRAVVDFMNRAGYDAWSLGNHDFDEGEENCKELVARANFPALAANLLSKDTGKTVDWVEPWIIKDFGDLRVGIVGVVTPETANMSFPANIAGLEFAPLAPTIREAIAELRAQDVDVILAVGHVGIPYDPEEYARMVAQNGWPSEDDPRSNAMDVAHAVSGIDAFFCGHIHKGFDKAWEVPNTHTLLFQTYGRGSGAGIVTLTVDTDTNQILAHDYWSARGYLVTFFEDEFWPDAKERKIVDAETAESEAGMDAVIGHAADRLVRGDPGTPLGNAVSDAMMEETGADFAFTNLGGLRDDLQSGPITHRDVFQVLPFGNKMVIFRMSGALLKQVVETRISGSHHGMHIAGGRIVFNGTRPDFDRITSFEIGGKPWDPGATYRVVTSDFLAQGNSDLTMLPLIPQSQTTYTGKTMREALEDWVGRHDPVSPNADGRWVRDDSSEPTPELRAAEAAADAP